MHVRRLFRLHLWCQYGAAAVAAASAGPWPPFSAAAAIPARRPTSSAPAVIRVVAVVVRGSQVVLTVASTAGRLVGAAQRFLFSLPGSTNCPALRAGARTHPPGYTTSSNSFLAARFCVVYRKGKRRGNGKGCGRTGGRRTRRKPTDELLRQRCNVLVVVQRLRARRLGRLRCLCCLRQAVRTHGVLRLGAKLRHGIRACERVGKGAPQCTKAVAHDGAPFNKPSI